MIAMDEIVLIGTSSLAREVTDFIERYKLFDIIGYTVNREYINEESFLGKPVFPIEEITSFCSKDTVQMFSTISWYNYLNRVRKEKFEEIKAKGYKFANLISPHSILYTEKIGEGNWIHDDVHLAYGVEIGDNNIFRTNIAIGHYTKIGNHNFFADMTMLGGHVFCSDSSFFGIGAIVNNRVCIGDRCVIGSGTVVKRDLPEFSLVVSADPFIKQCSEEKIETYISPKHMSRTVEEFNKIKK